MARYDELKNLIIDTYFHIDLALTNSNGNKSLLRTPFSFVNSANLPINTGEPGGRSSVGSYWTSSFYSSNLSSYYLLFNASVMNFSMNNKKNGFSVRCVAKPNMIAKNEFSEWMKIKEEIHNKNTYTKFSEDQIWWVALGKNVGVEINGKNEDFSRPILIFKKFSHLCFLAIPLTSQPHTGSWYVEFNFRGKTEYAVLSQIRMMSVSRLYNRMGKLSTGDFKKIKTNFKKLIK